MRYFFHYIYHFLISNSRHGTHSPFVYALADQVIYNPRLPEQESIVFPVWFSYKYRPLLHNLLAFMNIQKLSTDLEDLSAGAFWIESSEKWRVDQALDRVEEGKIVVVHQPYGQDQKQLWDTMRLDARVTISINLFHFGILLYRAGQRKEDFLLRYPLV